ncbi:septum site-determining protein MinC [Roseiarcus fermentans]|uniref:septum site-determining protein MinC n=1 Tax=Roseiarcus fermentans TaxID=1473586 RepID=UPI001FE1D30B|nr:septum site-determining protein MinC [Roseiarcus fermentans]
MTPQQALNFRGRSLLAFVLEPTLPLEAWFATLDAWLVRSPAFFAAKPVILEMAGVDIDLKAYRDLLGALARRHVRVMGVENASRSLVGPHLPPVVSGGRAVSATALVDDEAPPAAAPARAAASEPLFVDGNIRSGQSIVHPDGDVTIVGRVASGAEIVAGGSVHVYGALQGRVIAGISGSPDARIFCREGRAELLCIGGVYATAETMDPAFEGRSLEVRLVGEELKLRALD